MNSLIENLKKWQREYDSMSKEAKLALKRISYEMEEEERLEREEREYWRLDE